MPKSPDIPEAAALTWWAGFIFGLSLFFAAITLMACGGDLFLNGPRAEMVPYWFAVLTVPATGGLLAAVLRAAGDAVRQLHRIADAQDPRGIPPWPPMPVSPPTDEPPPVPRGRSVSPALHSPGNTP